MSNRASTLNLCLGLAGFAIFMVVLLAALGVGMGVVELLVWLCALAVGIVLIIRRYRNAREGAKQSIGR